MSLSPVGRGKGHNGVVDVLGAITLFVFSKSVSVPAVIELMRWYEDVWNVDGMRGWPELSC